MELKGENALPLNNIQKHGAPIGIEITLYTDPLCCWTWGMQPQWKKFLKDLEGIGIVIKYKMGGLLPSWKHFSDNVIFHPQTHATTTSARLIWRQDQ